MSLSFTDHEHCGVVRVDTARLDASIAIQFKDQFRTMTEDCGDVILDLSNVEFIDSSGLGAVVAVYKGLEAGRVMALAGLQPPVQKVMTLTRMNAVFAIFPTLEGALAAAGPTAAE
ncbi:STAS domain-containing protein [Gymnodinialimonas sp. 2305UL16-5]|uniref:STAS domain-containing protein n=1 Tax=Gymnodinialimonas mytili TaxID=3126503 RepID=UPI0030958B9F